MICGYRERNQNIFLNKKAVNKAAEKRMYEYYNVKRENFLKENDNQSVQLMLHIYRHRRL